MDATSGPHARREVERAESWNMAEDVMLVLWYGAGAVDITLLLYDDPA